jgi:hypothetical protein
MLRKGFRLLISSSSGGGSTSGINRAAYCSLLLAQRPFTSGIPIDPDNTSDTKNNVTSPKSVTIRSENTDHHGIDFVDRAAAAVHRLLHVLISARRQSANEVYVKRVLKEQVGLDEYDIERMWQCGEYSGQVFRLSVRHQIEPVVKYLKSYGICGSGLHGILREYPSVLGMDVDKELMPMMEFLESVLEGRSPALLLRYPWILGYEADVLSRLRDDVVSKGHGPVLSMFLWDYTELYCKVAENWEACVREGRARELLVALDAVLDERRRIFACNNNDDNDKSTCMVVVTDHDPVHEEHKKDSELFEAEKVLLRVVNNTR